MGTERFVGHRRTWTTDQVDRYDRAVGTLRALTAAYSARIAASDDPDEVAQLRADRARYTAQQRELDPTDSATIERIVREYPALVRQVRGEPA